MDHQFASLMMRASQAFGAPAQLARRLGRQPADVYRWIAGLERPEAAERRQFELRLRAALDGQGEEALAQQRRRWVDRREPAPNPA